MSKIRSEMLKIKENAWQNSQAREKIPGNIRNPGNPKNFQVITVSRELKNARKREALLLLFKIGLLYSCF